MAFNVNFPSTTRIEYPACVKVMPTRPMYKSNSVINVRPKSKNSYSAKIDSINIHSFSGIEDDYTNCMNGYITVSPLSMNVYNKSNFEKLKKVQF